MGFTCIDRVSFAKIPAALKRLRFHDPACQFSSLKRELTQASTSASRHPTKFSCSAPSTLL